MKSKNSRLLFVFSCILIFIFTRCKTPQSIVHGDGIMTENTYPSGVVTSLVVKMSAVLQLSPSSTSSLRIKGDKNILEALTIENHDGKIVIASRANTWLEPSSLFIYLSTYNLKSIAADKKNTLVVKGIDQLQDHGAIALSGRIAFGNADGSAKVEKQGVAVNNQPVTLNSGSATPKIPYYVLLLKNSNTHDQPLVIRYPTGGGYGITVSAGMERKESLPAGSKIYRAGVFRPFASPLVRVMQSDSVRVVFL